MSCFHLLCQRVEITLKALLLLQDYDQYRGQLKKPLGHDLEGIIRTVAAAFRMRAMRPALARERSRRSRRHRERSLVAPDGGRASSFRA